MNNSQMKLELMQDKNEEMEEKKAGCVAKRTYKKVFLLFWNCCWLLRMMPVINSGSSTKFKS